MVEEDGLVGYWKLDGDCRDHSGKGNHGIGYGLDPGMGEFNGKNSYVSVPNSESLSFGSGDFSICGAVYTTKAVNDVIGDILSKYDPSRRRGFNLNIKASSGGYNSQGNDKHVFFGIDDGKVGSWIDCGRPNENSNYANSLTVFDGKLYVGTTDASKEEDWCHVYRYKGDGGWEDCGRVGNLRTRGVGPIVVHDGELYAATWTYEFGARRKREYRSWDYGRVYKFKGGTEWEDCGRPGKNRRLNSMASYNGRLFVAGDGATMDPERKCYVQGREGQWRTCGEFEDLPHSMAIHDGKLYLASSGGGKVYAYDGEEWEGLGNPCGNQEEWNPAVQEKEQPCTQIHSLEVYKGELIAATWPRGKIAAYRDGKWEDCGRIGDSMERVEVNALTVYNGKLYAGTLPRAGVWRFEGGKDWTLLKRFLERGPIPVDRPLEWTRLTSLTVYDGKLFASVGSCTGSVRDAPIDVRGKVFCLEAGKCVSYDYNLGWGWKHIAAVKKGNRLVLYIDGESKASSSCFDQEEYNLTTDEPLKIGFGELDYFSGKIREIRLYNRAIDDEEVKRIYKEARHGFQGASMDLA